ncbi:MAG: hypothetical protein ABI656_06540, partial [bacterium]
IFCAPQPIRAIYRDKSRGDYFPSSIKYSHRLFGYNTFIAMHHLYNVSEVLRSELVIPIPG